MRKLYLFLTVAICLTIILLVAAFLYIDTHKHNVFNYELAIDSKNIAWTKLDKYVTEDKIIYRSVTTTPFHSICATHKRKLVLNKHKLKISEYNKKALGDAVNMDACLKRMDGSVSFLAIGHSSFAYLDRLLVDKDFVLFEENALISYVGIIAKYDFKKKGFQNFQTLTHGFALLPPLRQTIGLRLAGEKTIQLGNKNVDALHMILKLPNYKEASIWINKWSHVILKIENPRIGLTASLISEPKPASPENYVLESDAYTKEEISFKSGDIILVGDLTVPKEKGPHPAVLLVWGPGPLSRDGLGMFTNLADYFASRGIAVLSFDKRGVGKSQGKFSRSTSVNTIEDLRAALDFLAQEQRIDKTKIAVLGHSEGSFYASRLASTDQRIAACIIMAGMVVTNIHDADLEVMDYFSKMPPDWDKEYLADIARSTEQTMKIIREGKDWTLLQGKRIYLKKARMNLENNPLNVIRKLKAPTLVLQGKKDTIVLPEHAKLLEDALKEGGNQNYQLKFFGSLGHFFGDMVQDGVRRTHLTTNEKVMDTIVKWLEDNIINVKEEIITDDPNAIQQEELQSQGSPEEAPQAVSESENI